MILFPAHANRRTQNQATSVRMKQTKGKSDKNGMKFMMFFVLFLLLCYPSAFQ